MAVHPHACGENAQGVDCSGCLLGSPPRVWGKPSVLDWERDDQRFTPTRVGKTGGNRPGRLSGSVHPHACGENAIITDPPYGLSGSPPRVWGKLGSEI